MRRKKSKPKFQPEVEMKIKKTKRKPKITDLKWWEEFNQEDFKLEGESQ